MCIRDSRSGLESPAEKVLTGKHPDSTSPQGKYLLLLTLGAVGVVYGDIGTSPLYAMRECFHGPHALPPTTGNVMGVLSLIVWSLIIIISIKYVAFVMRADNRGEGGIMVLMSLLRQDGKKKPRAVLTVMGLFGAALLYGDGMITPAISVLSAVEGLEVATPFFGPYVIPITITILISLFAVQRRGTADIGKIFGPLMLVWFLVIGSLGLWRIFLTPGVLFAVNPVFAVRFFADNGWLGFLILGVVFLVVTGGESLYTDMGHFGRRPIRLAWFILVLPALLANYFGQGAALLQDPSTAAFPFYRMAPQWALYPLVILATLAASVASQAVISGAFSITRQAVQLGYSPRVDIKHTSSREIGQIYIPGINWALMFCTIGLVIGFGASTNLAAAYGVAVTTTMVCTSVLLYFVERELWGWKRTPALLLTGVLLSIDLAFFLANIVKVQKGGWFPLAVGAIVFTLMTTWRRGRKVLTDRMREGTLPDELFMKSVLGHPPIRVPGTAIFMDRTPKATPHALLHNLKHNKVLHETVILMTVTTEEQPHLEEKDRVTVESLGAGVHRINIRFGFMEDPNIPDVLEKISHPELKLDPGQTSYFLGRETLVPTSRRGMAIWRERLFIWMSRNATSAARFFSLPPNRVVEMGAQIEL